MNSNHPKYNASLDEAAVAITADNRELLQDSIESLNSDNSANAYLIKAWASDSLRETEFAIQQALEIEPGNETAVAGLNWINGIRELASGQLEAKRTEEARLQAEEEARLQAEEEARLQAEEEARLQAEEEARLQAEEEARLQAEEEARLQAEEEARLQAEEESRLQAEEEARLQAEEEARLQAEEEARPQAEEEARLQAEEEARREAELELERHAEFERHAELERQAELDRLAELELKNQAEEQRLTELAPGALSTQSTASTDDGQVEANPNDSIEAEIKDEVTALAAEVRQETQLQDNHPEEPTAEDARSTKKQVVLAVDDSPTVRKLVSLTLTREGFEVITAEDGVEALNILAEQLPDIILSDINMPKLNGYKLCKFVKKHVRTQDIPVVMLSGKDGVFDKMRGKMNGCTDFIAKPFESADLIAKIREILSATTTG